MFRDLLRERRRSLAVRNLADPAQLGGPILDRFVNAAASAFMAPMAAVSLVHGQVQDVKAGFGLPTGCMSRDASFCSFTLDRTGVLECCDPQGDPRFANLPSVLGEPYIRYYIGAPIRLLSGVDVGALCVVDTVRRTGASDDQKAYLAGLARQAALALESRIDLWGHAA